MHVHTPCLLQAKPSRTPAPKGTPKPPRGRRSTGAPAEPPKSAAEQKRELAKEAKEAEAAVEAAKLAEEEEAAKQAEEEEAAKKAKPKGRKRKPEVWT